MKISATRICRMALGVILLVSLFPQNVNLDSHSTPSPAATERPEPGFATGANAPFKPTLQGDEIDLLPQAAETGTIAAAQPGGCLLGQIQYRFIAPAISPCGVGVGYAIELESDRDVNLYIRRGQRVEIEDGEIIADMSSRSSTGVERILIDIPEETEIYFIAVENCSAEAADFTLLADVAIFADPPPFPFIIDCQVKRKASGKFVLAIRGLFISPSSVITINGTVPRKVKIKSAIVAGQLGSKVIIKGKVCRELSGVIRISNSGPNSICSIPFQCNDFCPD